MTAKDFLKFWLTTATDDWETAEDLVRLKHYHQGLFFYHLAIEKLLKGLVYKNTGGHAPPIHNLKALAKIASIGLSKQQEKELDEITSWNIRARYDSYKLAFYKRATEQFTKQWSAKAKEVFLWLKKLY